MQLHSRQSQQAMQQTMYAPRCHMQMSRPSSWCSFLPDIVISDPCCLLCFRVCGGRWAVRGARAYACHAGVPAWAQEASGPSIDPTRRLWGEEPSSDPAAGSYADYISEQEDEQPNEPQFGDHVRDRSWPCPVQEFCRT